MDGGEVHRQVGQHGHVGLLQHDAHRHRVQLGDGLDVVLQAHVGEVVELATRHLGIGVVGLPLALEAEQHVVGVELAAGGEAAHATVELHAAAQLEGEGLAVGRDRPALGQAGLHLRAAAGEVRQAVIDRPGGIKAGAGGVQRRGEILGRAFRAIDQGLGAGAGASGQAAHQGQAKAQQTEAGQGAMHAEDSSSGGRAANGCGPGWGPACMLRQTRPLPGSPEPWGFPVKPERWRLPGSPARSVPPCLFSEGCSRLHGV